MLSQLGRKWLIRKARTGNGAAFEELVSPCYQRLYHLALIFARNPAEAEDLTQETLLRAFRSFHRFKSGSPVYPYLAAIMKNVFLDERKSAKRRHEVLTSNGKSPESGSNGYTDGSSSEGMVGSVAPDLQMLAGDGGDGMQAVLQLELREKLLRCLKQIPQDYAIVVAMHDVHDTSYEDIASALDIPIGTVRSRIARGRQALRKLLLLDGELSIELIRMDNRS